MSILENAVPAADFARDIEQHARRLVNDGGVEVLHCGEDRTLAVLDARQYHAMVAELERLAAVEALREAREDVRAGRLYPAREALDALYRERGIARA